MYLLIVHGNNTIRWAKSYCELEKLHKSANKWSEILGGQTFPYSFLDLVNEFYGKDGVSIVTGKQQ